MKGIEAGKGVDAKRAQEKCVFREGIDSKTVTETVGFYCRE